MGINTYQLQWFPMVFRFAAKNVFLTYPFQQEPVPELQSLFDHLKTFHNLPVKYICVSRERHQDGNTHFHALLCCDRRIDTVNQRFFDFQNWHPKIEPVRSIQKSRAYVQKDGDFLEEGTIDRKPLHALCEEMDIEQWEEYCIERGIAYAYSRSIWDRVHPSRLGTVTEETDLTLGTIIEPLNSFTHDFDDYKSLVLVGPSGCGKTLWAKRNCPKPALFVSHLDRLSSFKPEYHQSIIFDDMSFKHFPLQSQIHLVDLFDDRDIHIRYRVVHIPKGTARIFTCNDRPFDEHEAIKRRIRYISINTNFI